METAMTAAIDAGPLNLLDLGYQDDIVNNAEKSNDDRNIPCPK